MKPSPTTPARVVIARECQAHEAMKRHAEAGEHGAFAIWKAEAEGWARLRSMLARDEPHNAWLN